MIIFQYKVVPVRGGKPSFCITVTDEKKNNVITWFFSKEYGHTLPEKAIEDIKRMIREDPALFEIPEELEPNDVMDGDKYSFVFSDGKRHTAFYGYNILDYGRYPRKNATIALRAAREIKEKVLMNYGIRTMISSRLQHWPKYRKPNEGMLKI